MGDSRVDREGLGAAQLWGDPLKGPLAGVRVVDFGQYIAGPLTAMLLADQGASVIRVDPPGGPRWDTPANAALLRGRRNVIVDLKSSTGRRLADGLISSTDVVVENFRPGVMDRLGVGPQSLVARNPQLIYCSLPGFGVDDRRANVAAWEGVVMAAGGAYSMDVSSALIPGFASPQSTPAFSPLPLASVFGALEAAMAVTAALIARQRDGLGQVIEVPLFDALFEASGLRATSYERNGPAMTDFGSGFYRCADGRYLTFIASWLRHLEWFVEAAGVHAWSDEGLIDFDRLWSDPDVRADLHDRMVALFATRPAEEWERIGRDHGCTIGMVRSTLEWMHEDHALASGTVVEQVDPVLGSVRVPGLAVRLSRSPISITNARRLPGADTDAIVAALRDSPPASRGPIPTTSVPSTLPLDGVSVLDLTRVVAGPTAAKLLGQLGADVIKIDMDPARSRAAFQEPAFHEHLNRGKRSLILDLKDETQKQLFQSLSSHADVVIENFTIGTAERLGIDEASLRRRSPNVIFVYLNTYGLTGPWAGYRGFAELANITTGVTERTCGEDEYPSGVAAAIDYPRWSFTDYAAGVLGAFGALLALYDRARNGGGQLVETSLVRATALEQIIYMVDYPGAGSNEPRGSQPTGWNSLQRLCHTADDWIFLGAHQDQRDALLAAFGLSAGDDDVEIDLLLQHAFAGLPAADCLARLHRVGIGGHEVTSVKTTMAPGGSADERGLRLEDWSDTFGAVVMPGPVARLHRTPMRPGYLPTKFGSDEAAILAEINALPASADTR